MIRKYHNYILQNNPWHHEEMLKLKAKLFLIVDLREFFLEYDQEIPRAGGGELSELFSYIYI